MELQAELTDKVLLFGWCVGVCVCCFGFVSSFGSPPLLTRAADVSSRITFWWMSAFQGLQFIPFLDTCSVHFYKGLHWKKAHLE